MPNKIKIMIIEDEDAISNFIALQGLTLLSTLFSLIGTGRTGRFAPFPLYSPLCNP